MERVYVPFVTRSIHDFHRQDFKAQPWRGEGSSREPQNCIPAFCEWCGSVYFIKSWPAVHTGWWGGVQPSVKLSGWESAPSCTRPWFSAGKVWIALSSVCGEASLNISGCRPWVRGRWSTRWTGRSVRGQYKCRRCTSKGDSWGGSSL